MRVSFGDFAGEAGLQLEAFEFVGWGSWFHRQGILADLATVFTGCSGGGSVPVRWLDGSGAVGEGTQSSKAGHQGWRNRGFC